MFDKQQCSSTSTHPQCERKVFSYAIRGVIRKVFPAKDGATIIIKNAALRDWPIYLARDIDPCLFAFLTVNGLIRLNADMVDGQLTATDFHVPRIAMFKYIEGKRVKVPVFERKLESNQRWRGGRAIKRYQNPNSGTYVQYSEGSTGEIVRGG